MGNCVGCVLPKTSPLLSPPNNRPETEEEGWFDKFKQGAKDAAQYYKDNISESMHEFGANAMDTGGKVAMAGGATAAAGGMVAATGIGAPVGAGMATAGGAAAAAGGVVGAVGVGTDSAATVLDTAATWITEGKPPDIVKPVVALGERVLTSIVLRKVPGLGGGKPPTKKSNSNSGGYTKGCKHLEKGPPGAKYQGGSHRRVQEDSQKYVRESHHIPPKSVSPHGALDGPAISMDYEDHRALNSTGRRLNSAASKAQERLAHSGPKGFAAAILEEINDIQKVNKDGKYNAAIEWMLLYAACMGYIGIGKK
ncbi:hypothetical protein [Acidovorax sp. Leaf78]|uniref:hypothetical protein n=1 Tax=Acidovorax sp. Leaf78 TaxID=1736237 RepID=UPI000A3FAB21|nr:hypothetical protein [Acidovorax sp. Leaf78]